LPESAASPGSCMTEKSAISDVKLGKN